MLPSDFDKQDFWAAPPREKAGDKTSEPLYAAIGEALSCWELVRESLAEIFTTLVESPSIAAARAYGSIASDRGRQDCIAHAAEIFFSVARLAIYDPAAGLMKSHEAQLKRLMKVVSYASARRNDVAHGIVVEYGVSDTEGGGCFLVPPSYNSRRNYAFIDLSPLASDPFAFTMHKYAYESGQIRTFARNFKTLKSATANFARVLETFRRKHPHYLSPPEGMT